MAQSLSSYYRITTLQLFILAIDIMFIIKQNVSRNSCVRKMQSSFADRLRRCSHLCLISRSSMLVLIIKRIYFTDMQCRCHCISMHSHYLAIIVLPLHYPRPNGAKRRSGRKPGARVTNFVLAEFKVVARDR